ncbi:MAG TPA: UDP-glucose 4-epimerase GalE [Patescibacteria group bacterium]|nr:UDP-glucose 4-epimerase GalE [Patescibacteria group bacterium]
MRILVTGGAGYIGSFMVKRLIDDGHEIVVMDSLEKGYREAVDREAIFVQGSTLDKAFLAKLFSEYTFDAVIHFAAYISVAESMERPGHYFTNNVFGTVNILEEMVRHSVNKIIFSSTAAVYGNPQQVPIPENHPKNPENPYGESKLMVEHILSWYRKAHGLRFVAFRYFNAAGAALDGSMGERHHPESHIIPNAIKALLQNTTFTLYGNDYNTPDKTCVRDYIHVLDLAEAHVLGLDQISRSEGGNSYNVGTGKGYSNEEVLSMIQDVSGKELEITLAPRRPGDADELVADSSKIQQELGFEPKHSDLRTIVSSAWKWHSQHRS